MADLHIPFQWLYIYLKTALDQLAEKEWQYVATSKVEGQRLYIDRYVQLATCMVRLHPVVACGGYLIHCLCSCVE